MTIAVSTVSSMYDLAVSLRDAVAAAMATTDAGAPDSAYVVLGEPAWPELCSQAVVQVPLLSEGSTNPTSPPEVTGTRHSRGRLNLVSLTAYAMRCVPVTDSNDQYLPAFQAPGAATLEAAAKAAYEDGWAVWNYVNRSIDKGTLFDGLCSIVHFDNGNPYTPEAGLGGWRFNIRVELGGYDPTGS